MDEFEAQLISPKLFDSLKQLVDTYEPTSFLNCILSDYQYSTSPPIDSIQQN